MMSNLIEVEIENNYFATLLDLKNSEKETIKLTTLTDFQQNAVIKIILNRNGSRTILKKFSVKGIVPKKSGTPRFKLSGEYRGRKLNLELYVDNIRYEDCRINLSKYLHNSKIVIFAAIAIIILLIAWGGLEIRNYWETQTETKYLPGADRILPESDSDKPLYTPPLDSENKTQTGQETTLKETSVPDSKLPVPKIESPEIQYIEKTIFFAPDSTVIDKEAESILHETISVLNENKPDTVEISGHCALSGTKDGRERLSRERALKTLSFLTENGWDPEIKPVVRWYGGSLPVSSNPEEFYKNRRVNIKIEF